MQPKRPRPSGPGNKCKTQVYPNVTPNVYGLQEHVISCSLFFPPAPKVLFTRTGRDPFKAQLSLLTSKLHITPLLCALHVPHPVALFMQKRRVAKHEIEGSGRAPRPKTCQRYQEASMVRALLSSAGITPQHYTSKPSDELHGTFTTDVRPTEPLMWRAPAPS
jgi:hypothetical protein